MAMNLCRNIRFYANNFALPAKTSCADRFPLSARCYSSRASSPGPVVSVGEILLGGTFMGWLFYRFDWFGQRSKHEDFLAAFQRRKVEYVKAELDMVEREIDSIKGKQCKSEDASFREEDVSSLVNSKSYGDWGARPGQPSEVDPLCKGDCEDKAGQDSSINLMSCMLGVIHVYLTVDKQKIVRVLELAGSVMDELENPSGSRKELVNSHCSEFMKSMKEIQVSLREVIKRACEYQPFEKCDYIPRISNEICCKKLRYVIQQSDEMKQAIEGFSRGSLVACFGILESE